MKEIVLNDVTYLRGKIASALIDEENVEFQNGLAVVKANIVTSYGCRISKPYDCYGVINEDYHEAYDDKGKVSGTQERNLMFLSYNRNIDRISTDDFIVEVSCGDEQMSYAEHRHIRIIDGVPTLIQKIGPYQKTSNPDLLITGWKDKSLYDVSKGCYLTPKVLEISESSTKPETFNVVARTSSQESEKYPLCDYLFFQVDKTGTITSKVLSVLANDSITASDLTIIEDYVTFAENSLAERLKDFSDAVTAMQNSNNPEAPSEELKRSRKNPDIVSE